MKRKISMMLAVMILVPSMVLGASLEELEAPKPGAQADFSFLYSTFKMINRKYPFEIDQDKLIRAGVKGMLQAVDENSDYYSKEEAENFTGLTEGKIVGIGVVIALIDGYVQINELMKGYPAEAAGLEKGDILVAIDDESVIGKTLSQVSSMIKGEEGSQVKVKVNREGEQKDFLVERKSIEINPVSYEIKEGNIGYISIDEFSYKMSEDVELALAEMDKNRVKKIIIDLRGNPGGLLQEAVNLADLFIEKGDIVHIRYRDYVESFRSKLEKPKYKLAVLVDGGSASASEIFAAAVQDRKAGTVIGSRTYGKGTVQSLMEITDGSLVKMTIAEYLSPKKRSIDKLGVEPDIVVENTSASNDLQLRRAIKVLEDDYFN